MHIWDTRGRQLSVAGYRAPAADALISAEFTYGGSGTCQGGTVRPVDTMSEGRDAEWFFSLDSESVFRGIPDNISDGDGQLAQVSLLPPHRPRLGGLGESLGAVSAGEFETLAAALERELGNRPDADVGITPEGYEITGVPFASGSYGANIYTLDDRAYDVRYIGSTYPDAVTDAVFDPGEGWRKYKYQRMPPAYALRRTGQAKADPAIAELPASVWLSGPIPTDDLLTPVGQSAVYSTFMGTPPKGYTWQSSLFPRRFGAWRWTWDYPADTDVQRIRDVEITVAVYVASVAEQRREFTWNKSGSLSAQSGETLPDNAPATVTTFEASRDDGTTISLTLYLIRDGKREVLGAPQVLMPRTTNSVGTFSSTFQVPEQFAGSRLEAEVAIKQTNGHRIEMQVQTASIKAVRQFPNTAGVQMPEGWDKPFRTPARLEFRLPGWHRPPFDVIWWGGRQPVASATVTWNRGECSTLITTGALGYG
ncbi:hypothetical protein [Deinococcus wulumuqiensis]|uniref:hypothetical protein n=1 Tax=Deinococcus wulumuqiensis TaxID=980427 RepID=UPI00242EF578|nr:hypothetical protein [Deinococcus wulumuqiensis]